MAARRVRGFCYLFAIATPPLAFLAAALVAPAGRTVVGATSYHGGFGLLMGAGGMLALAAGLAALTQQGPRRGVLMAMAAGAVWLLDGVFTLAGA